MNMDSGHTDKRICQWADHCSLRMGIHLVWGAREMALKVLQYQSCCLPSAYQKQKRASQILAEPLDFRGAGDGIRTRDLLITNQLLYP
jgi:hypothetical protein